MEKSNFEGFVKDVTKKGVAVYTNVPDTEVNDNEVVLFCVGKTDKVQEKLLALRKGEGVSFRGDCILSNMENYDTSMVFYVDDFTVIDKVM